MTRPARIVAQNLEMGEMDIEERKKEKEKKEKKHNKKDRGRKKVKHWKTEF